MKLFLPIILILHCFSSFGQDTGTLDTYVSKIDRAVFTDTVYLEDRQMGQKISVQGFLIHDTIVKAKVDYPGLNRTRDIYYKRDVNFSDEVCYIREFDSETGEEFITIKSWNSTIYESRLKNVINDDEKNNPKLILERSDFTIVLGFKRMDDQADKYSFSGKLLETAPLPAYCGIFAWATAFKFEIIETDYTTNEKSLVVIITCPRERGEEFYEVGKTYSGTIATNSGVTFEWALQNNYENEGLPTFWAREIEKE